MAQQLNMKKGSLRKNGFIGFSWTVLFFGFFVPFIRGDVMWGFIMLVCNILTGPLSSLVFAFIYNKLYTKKLLEENWVPANEFAKTILIEKELILEEEVEINGMIEG